MLIQYPDFVVVGGGGGGVVVIVVAVAVVAAVSCFTGSVGWILFFFFIHYLFI